MQEQHLTFNFSGRYFVIKNTETSHKPSDIWFVLHGQGQLARYFLKKFEPIASKERKIIAPEGLSRYYLEGFNGRVGASWMTRENRQEDISNYLEFLTAVYQAEVAGPADCKITLLGFSQGAATASRWALSKGIHFDRLILWAGLFPPDLNIKRAHQKLQEIEVLYVYGTQDPYLTTERIREQSQLAQLLGTEVEAITFEGGHQVDEEALLSLV